MSDPEPLVTLATFDTLTHAELALTLLDAEGIRGFLADAEAANTFSGTAGGIKLQVAKSDFLKAERVLNNRRGSSRTWGFDDYGFPTSKAITTAPGKVREQHSEGEGEAEERDAETTTPADNTVDRALRAAIFGLVLFPPLLHFYSLWLLGQIHSTQSRLSGSHEIKLWWTVAIDLTAIVAAAVIGQFMCVSPTYW